jgi:bifunctional DNA-binding transcriptional regulator/antitoxin component of YhaV-PrlF toxin-antitoxin module
METETRTVRAVLRHKGQLTLPAAVREALKVGEDDQVEFRITPGGDVQVRGLRLFPTDQAWFWAPEWQDGEQEASDQIKNGVTNRFDSTEDFLKALGG